MNSETYINQPLVSIIMPAYNTEDFLGETIKSVLAQTYINWELIIVDDCSTDNTKKIIDKYMQKDPRIQYLKLEENSGPAVARNKAIEKAKGKYLAFLDSDDLWYENKLTIQIDFMERNSILFSCTDYSKIDEKGNSLNRIIKARKTSNYNELLKTCPGNSTVIYNASEVGKIKIRNIKKRNDYLMWLQVIKKSKKLFGINQTLSSHRIREGGISNKKSNLVAYHWKIYRDYEGLSFIKSSYLIVYWIIMTVFRLR